MTKQVEWLKVELERPLRVSGVNIFIIMTCLISTFTFFLLFCEHMLHKNFLPIKYFSFVAWIILGLLLWIALVIDLNIYAEALISNKKKDGQLPNENVVN